MMATGNLAHSDECHDVLNKCDAALHAEIDLNVTKQKIIDDQGALIEVLNTELHEEGIWKPIALGAGVVIAVETLVLVLKK